MSSDDIKEFKKIIRDPVFKKTAKKLVDCSTNILAKKMKKILTFGAKSLINMLDDSDSEDSDTDNNIKVPYPEVENITNEKDEKDKNITNEKDENITTYNDFVKWASLEK